MSSPAEKSIPVPHPSPDEFAEARTAVASHSDTIAVMQDRRTRRALTRTAKAAGIRGGPTNIAVFAEALRRGADISRTTSGGLRMRLAGESHWWNNGATSLNEHSVRRIVPQKEVTSRVLRHRGVAAPENAVFSPGEAERAWAWAEAVTPAVVKPHDGSKGRGVTVGLIERTAFVRAFDEVASEFGPVLVEQQLSGLEHRAFVVDRQVHAVLRQIPANVLGDGTSSITALIEEKNRSAMLPHRPIALERTELDHLARRGFDPDSVPAEGDRVFLRSNTNLSTGGDSIDATDELSTEETAFVASAAEAWPGLRCAGIDIMLPRTEGDGPPAVIEINSAAGIGGHLLPRHGASRNVAAAVLEAMFPGTDPRAVHSSR